MRQLAAVLLFAVAAGCDGSDIDNGIADRADPATGPDVAERAPILTVSPAEFAPGETIAARAAFAQPMILNNRLKCPDPTHKGRKVDSNRHYFLGFKELDASGAPVPDKYLAQVDLPYGSAETGSWQELDLPPIVVPNSPASRRVTVDFVFSQATCEYKNSVGIPRINAPVIVSLPYKFICAPDGTSAPGSGRCRYVREDLAG